MRLIHILGIITITLALTACGGEKKEKAIPETVSPEKAETEEVLYYTCPMEAHKQVHSEQPGNCPECGMKMVPVVKSDKENAEFFGCPMPAHSHIRHSESGSCEECGMKLVPMRLVKT